MVLPKKSSGSVRLARRFLPCIVEQGVFVRDHAVDRLREHHPEVGVPGARALLACAEEVAAGFIAPFLGRSLEAVRDRYFLAADRQGVFVIVPGPPGASLPWTLRTYLRFGSYQQAVAGRLLGAA